MLLAIKKLRVVGMPILIPRLQNSIVFSTIKFCPCIITATRKNTNISISTNDSTKRVPSVVVETFWLNEAKLPDITRERRRIRGGNQVPLRVIAGRVHEGNVHVYFSYCVLPCMHSSFRGCDRSTVLSNHCSS